MPRKVALKENGLSGVGTPPEGVVYVGYLGNTFSQAVESNISGVVSGQSTSLDLGDVITNPYVLTGTQSETELISFKIPANFYKVGDMMTIGPSVFVWGGYTNGVQARLVPEPISTGNYNGGNWEIGSGIQTFKGVAFQSEANGYPEGYWTFSQVSTSESGSGLVVGFNYVGGGIDVPYIVLEGGDGYVFGEVITLEDKGYGQSVLYVKESITGDPQGIIRAYWSYTEGGLDNFCEQISVDWYNLGWRHIFNAATASNQMSGWTPAVSKIIDNTTMKFISEQQTSPPYQFVIATCSIPDITQDIWFTITGELENTETNLWITFIQAPSDIKFDQLYTSTQPFTEYITNTFNPY